MFQGCAIYAENLYEINAKNEGDFIRLVRPLGHVKGRLWYELKTFPLQNAPPYAALSYSWGTKAQFAAVILDNGLRKETVEITSDLEDALGSIRVESVADRPECAKWLGWLWVDQICINQADDLEKGHQVSKMKNIYEGAECVFVWLGKEMIDEGYESAMNGGPDCGLSYRKLIDLLHQGLNCWWNRLWVIQEISCCENLFVWIGGRSFPWDFFASTFSDQAKKFMLDIIEGCMPAHSPRDLWPVPMDYEVAMQNAIAQMRSLWRLRRKLRAAEKGEDLLELLRSTSPSGVSNELDRVYSLLGLATDDYRENVPVTYGVPRVLLFSSVIQQAIRRSAGLGVLFDKWPRGPGLRAYRPQLDFSCRLGMLDLPTANRMDLIAPLPTWMPDFSQMTQSPAVITEWKCAAGTFAKPRAIVTDSLELCLTSVVLDTVESISRVFRHKRIRRSERDSARQNKFYLEVLSELSMTNYHSQLTPQKNPEYVGQGFWRRFDMFSSSDKICFMTKGGYVGFASTVKLADEIIVPLGASAPFVVRFSSIDDDEEQGRRRGSRTASIGPTTTKHESKTTKRQVYELVGDCYIEGIMDGELEELVDCGQIETREYMIQ